MKNILILEDDNQQNKTLVEYLRAGFSEVCCFSYSNTKEAYECALNNTIHIFLLDVILENESGIDFAKRIRQLKKYEMAWIVFMTAYGDMIFDAMGTNYIDFIIKPYTKQKILQLLSKLLNYNSQRDHKKLTFMHKGVNYIFNPDDIIYIETIQKNLYFHTRQGIFNIGRMPISQIMKYIQYDNFRQCYRSSIVNTDYIKQISPNKGSLAIRFETIDDVIYIGNKYKENVLSAVKGDG